MRDRRLADGQRADFEVVLSAATGGFTETEAAEALAKAMRGDTDF